MDIRDVFPAGNAEAITPSDTADLAHPTRGIYVGGQGNLVVRMKGQNDSTTFSNIPAGTLLPIKVKRVFNTSTTATSLIALW